MFRRTLISLCITLGLASTGAAQVVVNEVQSANDSTVADYDGDYTDWIELYNTGSVGENLAGYGISDDADALYKWVLPDTLVPAGGHIPVWASDKDTVYPDGEFHANFKIQSDGEDIFLTTPDGLIVQRLPATPIPNGLSYGRSPDGSNDWRYFTSPTPGSLNGVNGYPSLPSTPDFSHEAGFYTAPFSLELTSPSGGPIRYTLDGSIPDTDSPLYTEPLSIRDRDGDPNILSLISTVIGGYEPPSSTIEKATVVRARVVYDSVLTGPTVTRTFFVDAEGSERYKLPVVSLVTDSVHLFSAETGVYVAGSSYDGADWFTANLYQRGAALERVSISSSSKPTAH